MDINFINEFTVAMVLGVCLGVGYIIKHAVPNDNINRFIPLILGVLGIVLNIWFNDWQISLEIVLGGLASGLASTGLHEAYKNMVEEGNAGTVIDELDN